MAKLFRKVKCLFNQHIVETVEYVSARCRKDRCVHCGKEYAYHPEFGHIKWDDEFTKFYKDFNEILSRKHMG